MLTVFALHPRTQGWLNNVVEGSMGYIVTTTAHKRHNDITIHTYEFVYASKTRFYT